MPERFGEGKEGLNKFFVEKADNAHLDVRFGKKISQEETRLELFRLLTVFAELCREHSIEPVLFHGGLIGYYFNGKLLPWDLDLDVVLIDESISNINALHGYENSSVLIEVNPNSINRDPKDWTNVIDARVISKNNGVFIDITFLTPSPDGRLHCKSPHYYSVDDIKPLSKALFGGCEIFVPSNIESCLRSEYGDKVFKPTFRDWIFDGREWVCTTE